MTVPPRRTALPHERTNNTLRIAASVAAVIVYAPMLLAAELIFFGGAEFQRLFEWMTGRCAGCSVQRELVILVLSGAIALTLPGLVYGLYIWVRRGQKSDRQATDINRYFKTAPDRIPPATVDVDPVERRFYRDRQGRLRPMDPSDRD